MTLQLVQATVRYCGIALAAVVIGGCAQVQTKKQSSKLETAVKVYADSIRWDRGETALAMLKTREGVRPLGADVSYLEEIRVVAAETRISAVAEDFNTATVTMTFDYYFIDQGNVKRTTQNDLWWFDAEEQTWYLDGRLPPFVR